MATHLMWFFLVLYRSLPLSGPKLYSTLRSMTGHRFVPFGLRAEECMKDSSRKKDVINISAVITAYEYERIEYLPGYFYFFVNGVFRSGPLPNDGMKAALGETDRIGRRVEMVISRWNCVNFGSVLIYRAWGTIIANGLKPLGSREIGSVSTYTSLSLRGCD